jgi:nitroreductase
MSAKRAVTEYPILEPLASRWSPYEFEPRPIDRVSLLTCLDAARWAASSYNEQPWHFVVALRDDADDFAKMLGCLVEFNQGWAKDASALVLSVIARSFRKNGTPNRMAEHDLGLAIGNFSAQATTLGLAVHQMAGFNPSQARHSWGIPDGYDPWTVIAVGHARPPAEPAAATPRTRRPFREFVFGGSWNKPW